MEESICGIIIGEHLSEKEALNHAKNMKNCPYLIALGTSEKMIYLIFIVPDEKRWWLKFPEIEPIKTGLRNARVFIAENIVLPEKFKLEKSKEKNKITPCGDNCDFCSLRKEFDCKGCPATLHYKG